MTTSKVDAPHRPSMDAAAAGLQTKSDKIRALSKAGYSRAEIARFLGIRYQHVRNVLVDDEKVGRAVPPIQPSVSRSEHRAATSEEQGLRPARVLVESDGRVSIPKQYYRALGLKEGDSVVATLEDDAIRLMSVPASVKRAQAIVRRFVPKGVSLVDELIAERRAEAAREDGHD